MLLSLKITLQSFTMQLETERHLVIQDGQWLIGGEVLQLGLEDDGFSSPMGLDHFLSVLVIQAAFVLDHAEVTQILTHVTGHGAFLELPTLPHREKEEEAKSHFLRVRI